MKGAPIPGAECQEGGMACDKGMYFDFTPKLQNYIVIPKSKNSEKSNYFVTLMAIRI